MTTSTRTTHRNPQNASIQTQKRLELTSRDICAIAISGSIQQFREGVY
jgi:hypothetical protein